MSNIFQEIKQLMAYKMKLTAKFAKQQSIINDFRQTCGKLINNALLGCHNNTRLRSSASPISSTAGSSAPARSGGVLLPTHTSVLYNSMINRVQQAIARMMFNTKKKVEMSKRRKRN
jgi:hypothetical protein